MIRISCPIMRRSVIRGCDFLFQTGEFGSLEHNEFMSKNGFCGPKSKCQIFLHFECRVKINAEIINKNHVYI